MPFFDAKFAHSALASALTTGLFFALGMSLDRVMSPSRSTLIAVAVSTLTNLGLQFRALNPPGKALSYALFYRYLVGHVVDIATTYLGCRFFFERRQRFIRYLPDYLRPYFNTVVRSVVMMVHFMLVAYPMRRYWIFT